MIQQASSSNINTSQQSLNSSVSPWLTRILYPLGCYVLLPLFFGKIKVTGQENIPQNGAVIVAPTHRSRWDALIIPYAVGKLVSGRDLRFMVSANEVKGLQGWIIRRMGGFPVDTEKPGIDSVQHSIELMQAEEMVVIFPEGGIFQDTKVHHLKRGVALIALQADSAKVANKVQILPVSIKYTSSYPSWGSKVNVDIGSPLKVEKYVTNSLRQSSQKLTKDLFTKLQELHETKLELAQFQKD